MQTYQHIGLVSGWGYDAHCWPEPPPSWQYSVHFFTWQDFLTMGDDELKAQLNNMDYWVGWSLGGLVLLDALTVGKLDAKKLLLLGATPRFCSQPDENWPGMAISELQRLKLAVARKPGAALSRFYRRFKLTPPTNFPQQAERLADPVGLDWLAEKDLRQDFMTLADRQAVSVWLGAQDSLINPQWLKWFKTVDVNYTVMAGMGHDWPQRSDLYYLLAQHLRSGD